MARTFHAYPEFLHGGDRLAETVWEEATARQAVGATLRYEPQAVILVATDHRRHVGLAPGGLAA